MKKIQIFIFIVAAFLAYGCYKAEDEFTTLKEIKIWVPDKDNLFADSLSQYKVILSLPGTKVQNNVPVTLTTDWGMWSNRSQSINLNASYNTDSSQFQLETYLIPGRTVQPFTITANSLGQEVRYVFMSIARFPNIKLRVAESNSLIADSASLHKVAIRLPSLKGQNNVLVSLTTEWGMWPNRSQSINLNAKYNTDSSQYELDTYLMAGRTVQPFTITANSFGQIARFSYNSIPRYPDLVHLVADSLTLSRKLGATTTVRAYFYSNKGFPSYGLRFNFSSNQNANIVPMQVDFAPNRQVRSRITLLTNSVISDTLIVTGNISGLSVQPNIKPAKIIFRE